MFFSFVVLAAGLALLVFAGDYLVKGAVGLAENFGISPLVIGLTVVAFGTSAPELFVSVQAALAGRSGIAVGNVVGSNIANVLLVLGIPALIAPVVATQPGIRRNMTFMLVLTAVSLWLFSNGMIGRLEGVALFLGICGFITWQVVTAIRDNGASDHDLRDDIGESPHEGPRIAAYLLGGLVGLPLAAHLTVTGASDIAEAFGVSDVVIGLTIVAIGTSLPELATTLIAALRKSGAVALGNVVGSNIFNLAGILGITAMIMPVAVDDRIVRVDMWVMLATTLLLAVLAYARISAGRWFGIAMLVVFVGYMYSFLL